MFECGLTANAFSSIYRGEVGIIGKLIRDGWITIDRNIMPLIESYRKLGIGRVVNGKFILFRQGLPKLISEAVKSGLIPQPSPDVYELLPDGSLLAKVIYSNLPDLEDVEIDRERLEDTILLLETGFSLEDFLSNGFEIYRSSENHLSLVKELEDMAFSIRIDRSEVTSIIEACLPEENTTLKIPFNRIDDSPLEKTIKIYEETLTGFRRRLNGLFQTIRQYAEANGLDLSRKNFTWTFMENGSPSFSIEILGGDVASLSEFDDVDFNLLDRMLKKLLESSPDKRITFLVLKHVFSRRNYMLVTDVEKFFGVRPKKLVKAFPSLVRIEEEKMVFTFSKRAVKKLLNSLDDEFLNILFEEISFQDLDRKLAKFLSDYMDRVGFAKQVEFYAVCGKNLRKIKQCLSRSPKLFIHSLPLLLLTKDGSILRKIFPDLIEKFYINAKPLENGMQISENIISFEPFSRRRFLLKVRRKNYPWIGKKVLIDVRKFSSLEDFRSVFINILYELNNIFEREIKRYKEFRYRIFFALNNLRKMGKMKNYRVLQTNLGELIELDSLSFIIRFKKDRIRCSVHLYGRFLHEFESPEELSYFINESYPGIRSRK